MLTGVVVLVINKKHILSPLNKWLLSYEFRIVCVEEVRRQLVALPL